MLSYWLIEHSDKVWIFNVFRYITFRTGAAIVTTLVFMLLYAQSNVRFTPKSGHQSSAQRCPLCAKSRHRLSAVERPLVRIERLGHGNVGIAAGCVVISAFGKAAAVRRVAINCTRAVSRNRNRGDC